jgi:NDP-sugar pyrophosphorylase family protein
MNNTQVIILASGNLEESFNLSGFTSPKNLLKIKNLPLLANVINSYIGIGFVDIIVAIRQEEELIHNTSSVVKSYLDSVDLVQFVFVNENEGPIATALLCSDQVSLQKKILFVSGDLLILNRKEFIESYIVLSQSEAGLFLSNSFQDRWSYVRLQGKDPIEIKPKGVISNTYAIGIYHFSNFEIFKNSAQFVLMNMRNRVNYLHLSNAINASRMFVSRIDSVVLDKNSFVHLASPGDLRKFLSINPL